MLGYQENAIVDRLFKKGQHGEISSLSKATVSYQDIYRLYPETWLNDEIINFYFELISDRASKSKELPSLHCFNTFFCSTLRDQGFAKVKRWTKRVDIFAKDVLFVPINQSYHWVLGMMDMNKKIVAVYDSLGGNHDHTLSLFLSYLEQEHLDKKKTPFDTSDWQKQTPKDIPQQGNMSDCGAFTCTFAERLSRQKPFNFTQQDMETVRRRMALNIYNKAI
ncbi:Senp1 mutant in complex with sumo-1 [Parasitella parasitica]|nr:Senp1 mutant in complex with sumo-1 [Parasitella parasitica]